MGSTCSQTADRHRTIAVLIVVGLALLVAAGLFAGFAWYEISVGYLPDSYSHFEGDLKDGEFWFSILQDMGNPFSPKSEHRIKRLHLQTGKISYPNIGLPPFVGRPVPFWIGNDLYVNSGMSIYPCNEPPFGRLPPISIVGRRLFECEGRLTAVVSTIEGGFRLMHLSEGQWVPGRRIKLPDAEMVWHHDPQAARNRLVMSDASVKARYSGDSWDLIVVHNEGQYHLMIRSPGSSYMAYRAGFEFIDESDDAVSALMPENIPDEFVGWEPIAGDVKVKYWDQMSFDREGPLFLTRVRDRVVRRLTDGTWVDLKIDDASTWNGYRASLVANPAESASYVILWDGMWSSVKVCRIDGQNVRSASVSIPGSERAYVQRWMRIFAELFCVWLAHVLIVSIGTLWVTRRSAIAPIEVAGRRAQLASLGGRTVAMLIDASILYGLIWLGWLWWRLFFFSRNSFWELPDFRDLAPQLLNLDHLLRFNDWRFSKFLDTFFASPIGWVVLPLDPSTGFFGALMAILVLVGSVKVWGEGQYGVTPGKWLMGLRTLGVRLQPCGTGRAIARDFVRVFDFPFLLTPIPAAISLMLSGQQQRFGDRLANTVVVKARSIQNLKEPEFSITKTHAIVSGFVSASATKNSDTA